MEVVFYLAGPFVIAFVANLIHWRFRRGERWNYPPLPGRILVWFLAVSAIIVVLDVLCLAGIVPAEAFLIVTFVGVMAVGGALGVAGVPVPIRPEVARHTHAQIGGAGGAIFSFKALFDVVVREQPEVLT